MPWLGSRILWLVALGGIVLIVSLAFFFREPSAQGRSLSGWLEQAAFHNGEDPGTSSVEIKAAIREIGPQAFPILLSKLRATDPAWKTKLPEFLSKQSIYSFRFTWASQERAEALLGFTALGTNAQPALPALEKMFWDTNATREAGAALGLIGEAALPILRMGLTNAEHTIRVAAYEGTTLPALAVATLPEMRQMRNDPDEVLATVAVWRLMKFASKEEATRVAIEALESKHPRLRRSTLYQLRVSEIETNMVVPVLVHLLEGPDWRLCAAITNILKRIDPVAAAAAGINTNPPAIPPPSMGGWPGRRGRGAVGTNSLSAPQK